MTFPLRALFVITLGIAATTASADDLTTTGGKKLTGKLVAVDAQGVTFGTGEAQAKVPGKDIVLIDLGNKVAPIPKDKETGKEVKVTEIELTDGSVIRAGKFVLRGKTIETELLAGPAGVAPPAFELPMTAVFSVMRGAEDAKTRDLWKKMLGSRGKRDLYVMRAPDTLNFVQGTILGGSEDGKTLDFETEDGKKANPPLLQSRATGGYVFAQPQPMQVAQVLCRVLDVYGNNLFAQSVEMTSSGVTVKTVSGVVFKYPSTAALAKLDYAQGNVAYLSDLDPQVESAEMPADERGLRVNVTEPYIKDRGLSNEPLKLGTDTFPKGLMIAPDTTLTFTINGDYRDFKAVLGFPENLTDANLEAKVTIEADGRVLFAETIKRKDKPKGVTLSVKGVKQLRVTVEGEFAVNGNRVILADARVQK
jgi:hypothetical protein